MERHDVNYLEAQIKELSRGLEILAADKDLVELIKVIRRPGWTTPAEFLFATGVVNSMIAQTKTLTELKQTLVKGSQAVAAKSAAQA